MIKKKKKKAVLAPPVTDEFVILGHLIKYNLYLMTKAIVFSSIFSKNGDVAASADLTNAVLVDLDLAAKRRADEKP